MAGNKQDNLNEMYRIADQVFKESEGEYNTLFETMPMGIVFQGASGHIISANPAAESILGLSIDQMQGRTSMNQLWRSMHEDGSDFPGETHPAMVALQSGEKISDVIMGVFNPHDDQVHWININAVPLFRPDEKKPYQVYTTFEDMTERKQAEGALKESEMMNRSLLDGSPVCNKIIDLDFNLQYMSSAGQKDLKVPDIEPYIGQPYPLSLYPESIRDPLISGFKQAVKGIINTLETPVFDLEGNELWYYATFVPAFDGDGRVRFVIVSSVNITERKRVEEELKRYSDNLEKMVEERTAELESAHEKLLRAGKLAAIGQFSAGVAHDLRNPLSIMYNVIYLLKLKLGDGDEKINRLLSMLETETKKSNDIIGRVMDFARTEEPQMAPIDIHKVIEVALSGILIPVNVEVVLDDNSSHVELPSALVDTAQIARVFFNVITNALQAMPSGGKLTINAAADTDYIITEFEDTGVGIAEGNLDKIFEPLFTTKHKTGGTGIGLAASKAIIEAHKGNIEVKSREGKGTTISVKLPARR